MGRRKIEIQPITHERNRSVTFLKRKNGLFKKAYELGVLCSVDVAVIIFEERPGHHVKLYQYCSTDVNSMVQRHLRFDGEKDTRGPADFSNQKANEVADDDDEVDEEDTGRATKLAVVGKQVKVKAEGGSMANAMGSGRPLAMSGDMPVTIDLDYRNAGPSPSNASSSSIPISLERHGAMSPSRNVGMQAHNFKRQRLGSSGGGSPDMHGLGGMQNMAINPGLANSSGYPYRLDLDMSQFSPATIASLASMQHGQQQQHQHPSLTALYPGGGSGMGSSQHLGGFLGPSASPLRSLSFPPPNVSQMGQSQALYGRGPGALGGEMLGGQAPGQFPSFDWPVHQQGLATGGHDGAGQPQGDTSWLDMFAQTQMQGHAGAGAGQPMTLGGRAASGSVSSQRSGASVYGQSHPPSSSEGALSRPATGQKRSRDSDGGGSGGGDELARPGTGMGHMAGGLALDAGGRPASAELISS